MRKLIIGIFSILIYSQLFGQENEFYYENAIYKEDIKSVKLHREGFELTNPTLNLNDEAVLVLKFDDLSGEVKNYYYTIIHCNTEWNESFISQDEYLEGFTDNPLDDYALSRNTTYPYVNYRLTIPNENVALKLSGNYVLLVYEDNDKEKLVLSKRFYVVEPLTTIDGTVRRATLDAFKGENHEVDFTIYHENLRIENPRQDVKVIVMQNNRWDNAKKGLKPMFIKDAALVYDYEKENVFSAGNEFRYFDIRSRRINGEGVFEASFHRPFYHITLFPDKPRVNERFFSYREMNGKYAIESQDLVDDYDLECDYYFVHFRFESPSILLGGTVNVFGELSNWNANKSNEMTWNFDESVYELTLLLKQGYYNYQYVYVEDGSTFANHKNLEGSFWEAENDYQILVYYSDISSRYDRLVGFKQLNSKMDRY